ncbi:hypothetical protein [Algibacter lectus]|uniref:hypothetical protein n=1 Tax=Algibacter lectus TaxID=221126 RepID=UPI002494D582|nr:hypothetical protein [Algibacter lectus]
MKTNRIKNSITYFLLVIFFSMKMAGFHVMSHTDDDDHAIHCNICDHAITNNLTPLITPVFSNFSLDDIEYLLPKEISQNYKFILASSSSKDQLFSRPPPFLL